MSVAGDDDRVTVVPVTGLNGTVTGTEGNDELDERFLGDPEGDRIDSGDAILPGAGPDDDIIFGLGGNDLINAGAGNDVAYGGDGNDIVTGNIGDDTLYGDAGDDLIKGGPGDDLAFGGIGNDRIFGNDGNDTLNGDEGDDTLYGEDGRDIIRGGAGDDVAFGGIGNDTLRGNSGDDTLNGDEGDDLLHGGTGNDVMFGGDGRDTFTYNPGDGSDIMYGGSGGDDYDIIDLTSMPPGSFRIVDTRPDSDGNGIDGTIEILDGDGNVVDRIVFENIEEIVPCFTPGTLIATPRGEKPVEELQVGDRVITRDNGIQEIRWVGHKAMAGRELMAAPHLRPVLVKAGSLGNGLPERDIMLSPNHRVLVANERTQLYFEESEVLAAVKHLVGMPGVFQLDAMAVTYIHFMFDRHEVVLSDGAWTESFQPGDMSLKGIGNAQRTEIFELFPELATRDGIDGYLAARKTLKKHEARLLMR